MPLLLSGFEVQLSCYVTITSLPAWMMIMIKLRHLVTVVWYPTHFWFIRFLAFWKIRDRMGTTNDAGKSSPRVRRAVLVSKWYDSNSALALYWTCRRLRNMYLPPDGHPLVVSRSLFVGDRIATGALTRGLFFLSSFFLFSCSWYHEGWRGEIDT